MGDIMLNDRKIMNVESEIISEESIDLDRDSNPWTLTITS